MYKKVFSFFIVSIVSVLLSGCLLNVETDNRSRGERWHESDLSAIRKGKTSDTWVLSAFGEPSRRIVSDEGSEIWRYIYQDMEETEVGFIFLFHIDVEDESTRELNIELEDGIVEDFWTRIY